MSIFGIFLALSAATAATPQAKIDGELAAEAKSIVQACQCDGALAVAVKWESFQAPVAYDKVAISAKQVLGGIARICTAKSSSRKGVCANVKTIEFAALPPGPKLVHNGTTITLHAAGDTISSEGLAGFVESL